MSLYKILQNMPDTGSLRVDVTDQNGRPVDGATAEISITGEPETTLESIQTDSNGQTESIELPAPPFEYTENPGVTQPYSEYSIIVRAPGFAPVSVNGIDIFSSRRSIQDVRLTEASQVVTIGPNTLFGDYPPKIPEASIKPITPTGEIVLDRVVVPGTVVVHDGVPTDSTASNYYVSFPDYVKNVACSEIYPTWPEATITANVIAIVSFTLNRVYTEWYRNKGYSFTITSSTAFDHKWINERNIFDNVGLIVDEVFADYVSKPDVKQPILTQYCDGKRTTCSGMSQWGSKYLGDQNYSALQILRNYYGSDIYINTAEEVSGIPLSWPGYTLDIGDSGTPIRTIQEQLSAIRRTYSNIPSLAIDGIYGEGTAAAVSKFQSIFGLPVTGEVDYSTWYKISQLYVALEKLAELRI
ncbi:MAG: peptidoglycan-binding protein [Lachnospiraceae bacterium]|nr:peptidoglycan-binding protein [Lachnospiraceae bacterium]